jgi:myosin heavy subunit
MELQDRMADLETTLESKDQEIQRLNTETSDWSATKQELEQKLKEAQDLNKSLQEEIEKLKAEQPHYSGENVLWKTKFLKLDADHSILQSKLKEQRELTDEVSQQGQLYLQEMRAMAESGGGNTEHEEKLQLQVNKLEEEVKEWKGRYAKTRTQLRSMRAASTGFSINRPDANRHAAGLQDTNGLVKDVHVTKFQIAIDELLRIARSDAPSAVLDHMKSVVLAVRGITSDIDAAGASDKDEEAQKRRTKLKSKVSATANNLITASKNFASAQGLSPVSLVDAAASHLAAAVVDLLHVVKIRPTTSDELQDDNDGTLEPLQSNGYFDIAETLRRRSAVESVYSALSTPSEGRPGNTQNGPNMHQRNGSSYLNGTGLGINSSAGYGATSQEEADLEDLKVSIVLPAD